MACVGDRSLLRVVPLLHVSEAAFRSRGWWFWWLSGQSFSCFWCPEPGPSMVELLALMFLAPLAVWCFWRLWQFLRNCCCWCRCAAVWHERSACRQWWGCTGAYGTTTDLMGRQPAGTCAAVLTCW